MLKIKEYDLWYHSSRDDPLVQTLVIHWINAISSRDTVNICEATVKDSHYAEIAIIMSQIIIIISSKGVPPWHVFCILWKMLGHAITPGKTAMVVHMLLADDRCHEEGNGWMIPTASWRYGVRWSTDCLLFVMGLVGDYFLVPLLYVSTAVLYVSKMEREL